MSTIPINVVVDVTPAVLAPGGNGLALNGLLLTNSTQVPIGDVLPFATQSDVADYFGSSSTEASMASNYFAGFDNSPIKPGRLYFAQYNESAVSAYLRGGDVTTMTVAELAALSGTLTIAIDGGSFVDASVSLAGATSYSNAASILQTNLQASVPTTFTSSSTSIAGTTMTVGGSITGAVALGQVITGSGITANSIVTAFGTGTGGAGTYTLSESSTVSSIAVTGSPQLPTVTFDSVSGGFVYKSLTTGVISTIAYPTGTLAPLIFLTEATGAVLSQGAAAATPAAFMTDLIDVTQNFACFSTTFDPDGGSGTDERFAFAEWNGLQNNRYMYCYWDTSVVPTVTNPANSCLAQLIEAAGISGSCGWWAETDAQGRKYMGFILGAVASIDFSAVNGRTTMAFRHQSGITPDVTNATVRLNLLDNGYNVYGAYATASTDYNWAYAGSVSGGFNFIDSYVNQIWLNSLFTDAMANLLDVMPSIPYNTQGYSVIENAAGGPIAAGLNFGAFQPGVPLTGAQQSYVNAAAGTDITKALFANGYYFSIRAASPTVRANRGSPPIKFFYTDAGSVQEINITSTAIL